MLLPSGPSTDSYATQTFSPYFAPQPQGNGLNYAEYHPPGTWDTFPLENYSVWSPVDPFPYQPPLVDIALDSTESNALQLLLGKKM